MTSHLLLFLNKFLFQTFPLLKPNWNRLNNRWIAWMVIYFSHQASPLVFNQHQMCQFKYNFCHLIVRFTTCRTLRMRCKTGEITSVWHHSCTHAGIIKNQWSIYRVSACLVLYMWLSLCWSNEQYPSRWQIPWWQTCECGVPGALQMFCLIVSARLQIVSLSFIFIGELHCK